MKLDDRPVIEQLLNPTPLNILEDAREEMRAHLDNQEVDTGKAVLAILRDAIKELDLDLSADTLDRLDKTLEYAADDVAAWIIDLAGEAVGEMSDYLGARL